MEAINRKKRESFSQSNLGIWTARKSAEFLLSLIESGPRYYVLTPSFITSVASSIEGEINTAYVNRFHKHFGKSYMQHVRPYLFMKLYDRFSQLPLVLSNFKYQLNTDDGRVRGILNLFEIRNRMLHIKHLWHAGDIIENEHGDTVDFEFHEPNHPDPYKGSKDDFPSIGELQMYMKYFNEFVPKFANISSTITRKNFNPEGWFVRIE
ncbi:MAG: hypothetical protein R3E62_10380 [Pseudomonadales bacterium]